MLEFFEDKHVIIVCTTFEQLTEWTKCKHFQIDLSFKRVMGEMNEFEINYYSNEHNLSKFLLYNKLIYFIIFNIIYILIDIYF